jgi:hypothetical protein
MIIASFTSTISNYTEHPTHLLHSSPYNSRPATDVIIHSRHSQKRAAQRGVSDEVISMVIRYGRLVQKQGLQYFFGATRNFPEGIDHRLIEKCSNLVVIVRGSEILTCYKNARGLKKIRKKREWLS